MRAPWIPIAAAVVAGTPACDGHARSSPAPTAPARDEHTERRETMVTDQIEARGVADARVLAALRAVPRHEFVPERFRDLAYEDHPLPIGLEQTISQPYIVALMTEAAKVGPESRVLEVGTGSGYQAAVLARICREVYSIEILPELADTARARLERLGFANVRVRAGDGYLGWPEAAPFDAVLVTAGAPDVPQPLVDQLRPGGRLVIPVGPADAVQRLLVLAKRDDGGVERLDLGAVRFVPLVRERKP